MGLFYKYSYLSQGIFPKKIQLILNPRKQTVPSMITKVTEFLSKKAAVLHDSSQSNSSFRLNEFEVYQLCDIAGLSRCQAHFLPLGVSESQKVDFANVALSLGQKTGRVILKVVGRDILHKSDVQGVQVLKVDRSPDVVLAAIDDILHKMETGGLLDSTEGVMAAEFVPHQANTPGQELLLSLRQDPSFGAIVVLGIGGTMTEWYGKGTGGNSTLIFPAAGLTAEFVTTAIEQNSLLSIFCYPSRLYRDPPLSVQAIVDAVLKMAKIGEAFSPDGESEFVLEEIEINPAVVSNGKLIGLDGVGLVSTAKWPDNPRPTQKITPLLQPRSAVVLGVSAKNQNPGRVILENLKRSVGIDPTRLYVIHHKETAISGLPCFESIADLPEKCDLAVISVPAQGALDAITELSNQDKAESIILIPGGFAEAGETDLAESIETALIDAHKTTGGGPVMVGGNCLGIVSRENYNTFFLPTYKLPFKPGLGENLAVVSQSGAYLVTFASNYDGVIFPRASISFGNQMDLTVADFLDYFVPQEDVNVVACYVEGFRPGDGKRFLQFAREAKKRGKKVIIFKAGKTALGAQAAASHTASLAGDYAVAKSCLEAAGITVAESLDEFEDLIKTFTLLAEKKFQGNKCGIISNAGFECSTVMDQLEGLELASFGDATQGILDEALPAFAHRSNPIDCTPMTGTVAFVDSCAAILNSPEVDVAILASVPVTPALNNLVADSAGHHREDISQPDSQPAKMLEVIGSSAKPAVVVVDSGEIYDPMCRMLEEGGIPVFRKIDRAARALAAYCRQEGAQG